MYHIHEIRSTLFFPFPPFSLEHFWSKRLMKNLKWALFLFVLLSGVCPQIQAATLENAEKLIQKGEFTAAKKEIDLYIAENDLSKLEIYNLNARKEILDRIALDFDKDLPSVLNYVKKYYPEADEAFLRSYEKEGSLQMMVIDGKKWYFDRGATNMFRINEEARKRKQEIDPPSTDKTGEVLKVHLPQVIQKARETGNPLGDPVRMKVKYTLTVRPDAVPPGETLRCWLPFPREHRRQKDVITHWVNSPDYIISPDRYEHKALYMEKKQQPGKPTVFEYEFSYTSFPEWFDLKPEGIKPYDKESELYKKYTAERDTHVIFSEPIRELSEKVVGDEKNPYLIVDRIMRWIREEYPWAGAREYSTFENIP